MNKIDKAKISIALKDKLLSYLLSKFPIIINDSFGKTAATNGKVIYFNPEFLETLTVEEVVFILLHELLHITLDHPFRRGNRDKIKFNIAADIVVNDILINADFNYGKLTPVLGSSYRTNGLRNSVESIYDHLEVDISYIEIENHQYWDDFSRSNAKKLLKEANEKGYSSESNVIKRTIDGFLNSSNNWRNILQDILIKNEKDYTYDKVDNRYQDVLLPYFDKAEEHLNNVWFVLDVSGSMSDEEVVKGFSEISKIINSFDSVELKLSFFSTFVTKPEKVSNLSSLKTSFLSMESGGGTSFSIIFDYLNELETEPIAIIIITDGYARFPSFEATKNIPVFWAITNDEIEPEFGYKIII